MNNKLVAVVIPVYKEVPDEYELRSFLQCVAVLGQYDIYLVAPENLSTNYYTSRGTVFEKKFCPTYFKGIEGYNRLLLSSLFYQEFMDYEYILIHQLDCYVFRNELRYWCEKQFDYIGAPWLNELWHTSIRGRIATSILRSECFVKRQLTKFEWYLRGLMKPLKSNVGNGGFSLRKVKVFYEVACSIKDKGIEWSHNEDLLWAIYVPLTSVSFKVPPWKRAIAFSFDYNPQLCFRLTEGKLPFAAHAWAREDTIYRNNRSFWEPIIRAQIAKL